MIQHENWHRDGERWRWKTKSKSSWESRHGKKAMNKISYKSDISVLPSTSFTFFHQPV